MHIRVHPRPLPAAFAVNAAIRVDHINPRSSAFPSCRFGCQHSNPRQSYAEGIPSEKTSIQPRAILR
jgi:hypothetical protein